RLGLRHEALARKLEHGRNDARIGHVAGADLAIHHHAARGGKVGHFEESTPVCERPSLSCKRRQKARRGAEPANATPLIPAKIASSMKAPTIRGRRPTPSRCRPSSGASSPPCGIPRSPQR